MIVAIVGGRDFRDWNLFIKAIDEWQLIHGKITCIVSGKARGADEMAARYAKENDIELIEYEARWDVYGKSAGYRRNIDIVDSVQYVIAFYDGKSKGTGHTIQIANDKKKPLLKVPY